MQRPELPFRFAVIDEFIPAPLCRAACAEWPAETWPFWLRYEGERGDKFVSKDPDRLTPACRLILARMAEINPEELLLPEIRNPKSEIFPDLSLYGAGMSMILPGGDLPRHLDGDHNPVTGWGRAASAIVYLSDCSGGELLLWDGERAQRSIRPVPGRLALFECNDQAWHSVAEVTAGRRLSLSLFFWTPAGAQRQRSRARFQEVQS